MNGVGKVVPPKKVILEDISLNFFPGAKIGVLGYNGAGKSTLIKATLGLLKTAAGDIRIFDEPVRRTGPGAPLTGPGSHSARPFPVRGICRFSLLQPPCR